MKCILVVDDSTTNLNELIIYGEGEKAMKDIETVEEQPWNVFNQQIKKKTMKHFTSLF